MTHAQKKRTYIVGAVKIAPEDRDVAHAVITPDDDRAFHPIIGSLDDPHVLADPDDGRALPVGSDVSYRVELTDTEADLFRQASNCRYVEPDGQAFADAGVVSIPSTTTLAYMRAKFTRADALWHGRDVTVGILDGGTTTAVRTFMNWTLVAKVQFQADPLGSDEITNTHGCLVAPNGVPYGGRIMDLVIGEDNGGANFSRSADAMRYAADQGVKILNYSYSQAADVATPQVLVDAATYLRDRGVQLFASAGNDSTYRLNPPSSLSRTYANVHSSVAFDENTDARASFSNYHEDASGCSPGANVLSLSPTAEVQTWNGTSASSPHMAMLCARGCTAGRYTAAQVGAALKANTRSTGQTAQQQGKGAYDLGKALTALGAFTNPIVTPALRNLCLNPSFEANTSGLVVNATRAGITATTPGRANSLVASAGTYYGSVNLTGDGSTSGTADVDLGLPGCAVVAGTTYTFQGEFRHSAVNQARIAWYIIWRNAAGAQLSTSTGSYNQAWVTEWVRHWHTVAAPTNAVTADVRILVTGITDTTARSFRVDTLRYHAATQPGDYFDGSSTGASWDGVASNSTSTLDAVVAPTTPPSNPPPAVPSTLSPLPNILDGIVVTAADLMAIRTAYETLYNITLAGFRDSRPSVRVSISAGQAVASSTDVLLSFGAEQYDTDAFWAIGNPTQIVIPIDGLYQIGASLALVAATAPVNAKQELRITRNSTTPVSAATLARGQGSYGSGTGSGASCSTVAQLAAGDILRVYTRQNSGSNTNTDTAWGGGRAYAYWIGPPPTGVEAPAAPPEPPPVTAPPVSGTEAASLLGWGAVVGGDEFEYTGAPSSAKWGVYNGEGHGGNGLRSPSAWNVSGGICTVTGDANTKSGGMSYHDGAMYCRVEIRMRTYSVNPAASGNRYHPVLLMWPDSEQWPEDGELDFFETNCDSGELGWFMHYPRPLPVKQEGGSIPKDIQNFANYAFEWSPSGLRAWCDGVQYFNYTQSSIQPPGPMHLCIQLDAFHSGGFTPGKMDVMWVRFYNTPW